MKGKKALALLLATAMMLSMASCSKKGQPPVEGSQTPAVDEKTPQNPDQIKQYEQNKKEVTADNVVRGGTLRVGSTTDVNSYAPWRFRGEWYLMGPCYETLVQFDDQGNIVPYLCESLTPDPEKLTYTVKCREGVTFSDGSSFDGDCLLWNFENFKENSQQSKTFFSNVDHFEKTDDMTVVIHLNQWDTQIPYSLNNAAGTMYSKKAFEEHGYDWCLENPVGTGPYVLKEYTTDANKTFVKSENYWNKEAGPLYDEIKVTIFGDNMSAQAALMSNAVDVFNGGDYGMKNSLVDKGYNLYQNRMWYRVYFLIFSSAVKGSPFEDVRVRQAVSYAIDSETMVSALDYGRTFVSNQYAVEGTGFYNPDVKGYGYDPDKARELLTEAGYPNGFTTKLVTGVDQKLDRYMVAIQGYLAEVGIQVELEYLQNAQWQASGIYEIDDGMILCGHGYGSNLVNQAISNFSQRAVGGVGMLNKSKIHPDDLNELLVTALGCTDEAEMYSLMQQAEKLIIDEYCIGYPVITSYYDQILTQPDIVDEGFCNSFNRCFDYNKIFRIKE